VNALKNTLIVLTTRVLVATLSSLPRALLRALGSAVGLLAWALLPGARREAKYNLALAFPDRSTEARSALARRAFITLGALLGDTLARLAPHATYPAPLPFDSTESRDLLARAVASKRGVMLLSAHLGPYEDVARSLIAHGTPLLAVTKAAYDPRLEFVFTRLRRGVSAVARDQPGAAVRMVRHLRGGGVLGVPMDLASRVPSIPAPFFGQLADTPVGPARIALRTRAVVVVCTAVAAPDGGHALRVTEVSQEDLGSDGAAREQVLTRRINDELCTRIRSLPQAWPWMHPRFRQEADGRGPSSKTESLRLSGLAMDETR
jgi:KDO2-lipid IV(A) lauroyltransferase